MLKTCLDEQGLEIKNEIYRTIELLGGDPGILAAVGSWGDTLDDGDILDCIKSWNEMGEVMHPDEETHGKPRA